MFAKTITLHLDFHKSLPTPKVSSQDWYYSKKLRTNLLGIYCANQQVIHCFMYDESIAGTGPNEVISILDYTLGKLQNDLAGRHDQLIVWCDNSPAQFKENYLFFYLDYLVRRGDFLRADLKFLLAGHSYSVCDRRFGNIQKIFDTQEIIQVPEQWATVLNNSGLSNVKVHWVTLDMIKDYKSFLKLQYVARNEDLLHEKFEVKNIAWLNFGYGEKMNAEGNLELVHHPDEVFIRFCIDPKELPKTVSYLKKKQATKLYPQLLSTLRHEKRPVRQDVKRHCVKLARKYLNENAERFYEALPCIDKDTDSDNDK